MIYRNLKHNSIFKHKLPLIIIFVTLSSGIAFAYYLDQGVIDDYFQKKYYKPEIVKIIPAKLVKIGFTTDAHSSYKKGDLKDSTPETMEQYVKVMQQFQPDFVVDGGDLIEGTKRTEAQAMGDFNAINEYFEQISVPKYYVLGNHELRGFNREKWLQLTGLKNSYYYFDVNNLRVIVLDGNYEPSSEGDIPIEPGLTYTRGYVNQGQMVWLEDLLKESENYRKIVFLHQPPLDSTNHKSSRYGFPAKAKDLRKLFSEYGVMAVFSGHIEEAYHEKIDGVDYYITPGFHKDNDQDEGQAFFKRVFSEIEVKRGVSLKMYYKNLDTGNYQYLYL